MSADELWGYAWSREPERWEGACATREEAIAEAMAEMPHLDGEPDPVGEVWIARGSVRKPSAFVPDASRIV